MIIFNIAGDFHGVFDPLPNESYLDESKWIIAEFAEGESFDERYNYSPVDGIAIKGDLIPVDLEEEARMKAEYAALQYQRDRWYPSIGDQLDLLFHDMTVGKGSKTGEWYKAIAKVKADNPKE